MICRRCGCEILPGTGALRWHAEPYKHTNYCLLTTVQYVAEDDDVHRNAEECMVALKREQVGK